MASPIEIVAVAARTPLGGLAAASAAIRAGVPALGQHPFLVDSIGDLMPAAMDSILDPHLLGANRLIGLAESALQEASEPLSPLRSTRHFYGAGVHR